MKSFATAGQKVQHTSPSNRRHPSRNSRSRNSRRDGSGAVSTARPGERRCNPIFTQVGRQENRDQLNPCNSFLYQDHTLLWEWAEVNANVPVRSSMFASREDFAGRCYVAKRLE